MNYASGVIDQPLVIGHRGASAYRPEHTRSAYRLAVSLGADAVEPDVVMTRDGVLVVRHENEISGTTNVADVAAFADRRTTKVVDGVTLDGWFTEDFTWAELAVLKCRERLPALRPGSAAFDDQEPILRFDELLALLRAESDAAGRPITLVLEVKHPTYFASIGLPMAETIARDLAAAGWSGAAAPLVVECFELDVLRELSAHVAAEYVFLIENEGAPADFVARSGDAAPGFDWFVTPAGLDSLAGVVQGVSVNKARLLRPNTIVADAAARGLQVFVWTLRPENAFLEERFRLGDDPAAWGDYAAEWREVLGSGVAGAFADHPDLLRKLLPRP